MRHAILVAAFCLAAWPAVAKDITVTATPILLNAGDPQQTRVDSLEFVAGFVLKSDTPEWGGYSGMIMAPDGSQLVAISDVGHWLKLALQHDGEGRLTGIGAARIEPLLDEEGKPLASKDWSDAEAIARLPNGDFIVAFERHHRLWRYASADGVPAGPAQPVAAPEAITALPDNSGIEAVAVMPDGRLILAAEGGADPVKGARVWIRTGQSWQQKWLEHADGFDPTDMAPLTDDYLVLLERRYNETDGPAARISVIGSRMMLGDAFTGYTLAVLRLPLSVDNFEDIALRAAPSGDTYIYVLSDDNQSKQQRTLLLQFKAPLTRLLQAGGPS
jgi:hypothetical protein